MAQTNYALNGSAEQSGAAYTSRFSTNGSGGTSTRVTSESSHGVASAHLTHNGLTAFAGAFAREIAGVQGLGGLQVWAKFRWKGSGLIKDLLLQCYKANYSAANNTPDAFNIVPPADWTYRVMGPVTMQAAGDIGDLRVTFTNLGTTDGSGAFDIYVDEVMFTTFDPTNTYFFEGTIDQINAAILRRAR